MGLGFIITLSVIFGFVLLVVWAVRRMSSNSAQPGALNMTGQSPKDIVQLRYAKGEINREEYQQILSGLKS
jgi:putative membrane protein